MGLNRDIFNLNLTRLTGNFICITKGQKSSGRYHKLLHLNGVGENGYSRILKGVTLKFNSNKFYTHNGKTYQFRKLR